MRGGRKSLFGWRTRIDNPNRLAVGERVTFEDLVWIKCVADDATVEIGDRTFLGRGTEIDANHLVKIGSNVLIGPNVFITDHNHRISSEIYIQDQGCSRETVVIGNDVWIGTGVTILPGVSIADGAVVGAGAVVTKNVGFQEIWGGVPAKKIGVRKAGTTE